MILMKPQMLMMAMAQDVSPCASRRSPAAQRGGSPIMQAKADAASPRHEATPKITELTFMTALMTIAESIAMMLVFVELEPQPLPLPLPRNLEDSSIWEISSVGADAATAAAPVCDMLLRNSCSILRCSLRF